MRNLQVCNEVANVFITFTARDWQLFTSAGSDEAALEMNKALGILILENKEICQASVNTVYAKMGAIFHKFSNQGADDGEAAYWLRETLREVYGVDNCKDIV